ncbi:uncharacterized protein LOC132311592 [Cornus florida]|uniref:uncharacterized protein LOC132311592 n=1 Tax=Cornus florida TaxID=4283 RepID=UPI00289AC675|nr:uncharacterized protein LOC132311592 [Cornus florida]
MIENSYSLGAADWLWMTRTTCQIYHHRELGEIYYPGSEIPQWFSHKIEGEGSSMCWRVDDLTSYNNVKGIAICIALESHGICPWIGFNLKINGYSMIEWPVQKRIESDHVMLMVKTEYDIFFDEEYQQPIKNLFPNIGDDGSYIEVSAQFDYGLHTPRVKRQLKVKKFGIHLIMDEQDEG